MTSASLTVWNQFKRISHVAGARIVAAVMQAFIIVFLARELEPAGFGAFAALTSIGALVGVVLGFGATTAALRVQASDEPQTTASNLIIIRILSVTASAICVGGVGVLSFPEHAKLLWFVFVYLIAELLIDVFQALLLGKVDIVRASIGIISRRLFPLVAVFIAHGFGLSTLGAIALGASLSVALGFCLVWRHLGKPGGIQRTIRRSRHYWSSTTIIAFQRLDIFLVSAFGSAASGGAFAAAQRLTSPANTLTGSILGIVTPQLSGVSSRSKRLELFRSSLKLVVGVGLALTIGAPLAGYLAPRVLGDEYVGIGLLVTCAVVAAGLDGIAQVYASHYYAEGRARQLFHLRLVSVPAGLVAVAAIAATGRAGLLPVAILVAPILAVTLLHLGSTGSRKV